MRQGLWIEAQEPRSTRVRTAVGLLAVVLCTVAATSMVFEWNAKRVQDETTARALLALRVGTDAEKLQAVTVVQRSALHLIEQLRDATGDTGRVADESQRAIENIHRLSR